jgi:hypothetical protein
MIKLLSFFFLCYFVKFHLYIFFNWILSRSNFMK